jgi:hypothetical protein
LIDFSIIRSPIFSTSPRWLWHFMELASTKISRRAVARVFYRLKHVSTAALGFSCSDSAEFADSDLSFHRLSSHDLIATFVASDAEGIQMLATLVAPSPAIRRE